MAPVKAWIVPIALCLLAALCQAQVVAVTRHGLALPDPEQASDAAMPLSYYSTDDDYFGELERQELMAIDNLIEEQEAQQQRQAEELAAVLPSRAIAPGFNPSSASAAVGVDSAASSIGRDVRAAIEQAQSITAQLLSGGKDNKNIKSTTEYIDGAPVNVVELAAGASSGLSGDNDIQIDVTVTTERSGPTWMLPSIFPSNMPSMFVGMFGSSEDAAAEADKQGAELAAQITQQVMEQALASKAAGNTLADQELILDMTVDNATPQTTEKLVAAAAAAAATAAATVFGKPYDSLELQMEVVETTVPFFKSGRFYYAAMLLLSLQLLLCLAVALLWGEDEEEEDEEESDDDAPIEYVEINLQEQKRQAQLEFEQKQKQQQRQQQQQSEWASLAEEGKGIYAALLSYV